MRRLYIAVICAAFATAAGAVTLINTDFTTGEGYANGDLTANSDWDAMPNTGSPTFDVTDASGAGIIDNTSYLNATDHDTSVGNQVYITPSNNVANAVDDEISGSMVFTLAAQDAVGTNFFTMGGDGNWNTFLVSGLTGVATNRVAGGNPNLLFDVNDDGNLRIRYNPGTDNAGVKSDRVLFELSSADIGWDPTNAVPNYLSESLQLDWTWRKTRTPGYYNCRATITNLDGTAYATSADSLDLLYSMRTNTYNAANTTFGIGAHANAYKDGRSPVSVQIDSLSVDQTSGNGPGALVPTALSASAGNGIVELSWTVVPDADNYEIYRSGDGSLGSKIAETNGLAYADTSVVNDLTYYYTVRATAAGATSSDSNQVEAEPQAAATGTIIDTDFSNADVPAYSDGDIDGQNRWKDATLNGSPAFAITDAAGSGFADSEPYTNSFDTSLGNGVYYNRLMSNNVGDEWTASLTFKLKASPVAGQTISDGTNSYDVAAMGANEVFKIGLSSSPDSGLEFNDANDVFVVVRSQTSARLDFQFNVVQNQQNKFGQLNAAEAGWDPNWGNAGSTPAPDFETDPITMNFKLRKASSPTNTYTLVGEVICNGLTNRWNDYEIIPYDESTGVFNADFVYLCMGIDEEASERKALVATNGLAVGDNFEDEPYTVAIDALSVVKADQQPPALSPPVDILSDVSDGTAILEWTAPPEAQGYTVRRYATYEKGAPVVTLITGLGDTTYSDSGLTNGYTYFYTVASEFGGFGEAESAVVPIRPLGKSDVLSWCFSPNVVDTTILQTITPGINTNGVLWCEGDAGSGQMYTAAEVDTSVAPILYFYGQILDGERAQSRIENSDPYDYAKLRTKNGVDNGYFSGLVYMDAAEFVSGLAFNVNSATHAIELETYNNMTGNNLAGSIPGASLRAAVRSGGQWYVSETEMTDDDTVHVILDMAAENWAPFSPAITITDVPVTVTNAVFNVPGTSLTAVDAVGYFADLMRNTEVAGFKVTAGETATKLQLYMDSFFIFNEAAAATNDYDSDGVANILEWAFLGDPADPNNDGRPIQQLGVDATGTKFVYVYPRLDGEPRPVYSVVDRNDLFLSWGPSDAVEDGAGLWNPNNPGLGLEAVTNLVPIDSSAKFVTVDVTEE